MGFLDLIDQAFKILPKRFGGTGNDAGHSEAVVNGYTAKAAIPLYSPVRVSNEFNRIATSTSVDDVQIVGVVIGKYAQLAGEPELVFQRSAPSNAELAAVMQMGRTPVTVSGTVARDQYLYQSSSAGLAKGSNSYGAGAFGRFLAAGSNSVSAYIWPTSLGGSSGGSGGDEKAKVSFNDTTAGYLNGKLLAGNGIVLTEQDNGSNETLVVTSIGSNLTGTNTRGCSLYHTLAQSIPDSADTTLTWGSEVWDSDNYHSTSSFPSRITIPPGFAGRYRIGAHVQWPNNPDGRRDLFFLKNGTTRIGLDSRGAFTTVRWNNLAREIYLSAGEYVEVQVAQTSGIARDIEYVDGLSPIFTLSSIGLDSELALSSNAPNVVSFGAGPSIGTSNTAMRSDAVLQAKFASLAKWFD